MTPKEKAEELVNKYINAPFNCADCDMPYCDIKCTRLSKSEAKICALIAVDLIIYHTEQDSSNIPLYEFYLEVKQEIENL